MWTPVTYWDQLHSNHIINGGFSCNRSRTWESKRQLNRAINHSSTKASWFVRLAGRVMSYPFQDSGSMRVVEVSVNRSWLSKLEWVDPTQWLPDQDVMYGVSNDGLSICLCLNNSTALIHGSGWLRVGYLYSILCCLNTIMYYQCVGLRKNSKFFSEIFFPKIFSRNLPKYEKNDFYKF